MLPAGRTPSGHVAFAPVHVAPLHSLCHHATGAPLAMTTYSGGKDDCELPTSQALLAQIADVLPNATITGDALNCQKKRR